MNERIQNFFQTNAEFKENEIGKPEDIFNREAEKLRVAAENVLSKLTIYELGEAVPDVDIDPIREALEEVEADLTDVDVNSQQIDEVSQVLSLVQNKLNNLYSVMTQ